MFAPTQPAEKNRVSKWNLTYGFVEYAQQNVPALGSKNDARQDFPRCYSAESKLVALIADIQYETERAMAPKLHPTRV